MKKPMKKEEKKMSHVPKKKIDEYEKKKKK
jgi:hypothetical protein